MPRRWYVVAESASARSVWLALSVLACSSDDPTLKEPHDFRDGEGRSCRAVLERTSETSAVISSTVECDGSSKECSSESAPCFQLSVARMGTELRNCPACCKGSSSSFTSSECSPVTCADRDDCVFSDAECVDGICSCADGRCE